MSSPDAEFLAQVKRLAWLWAALILIGAAVTLAVGDRALVEAAHGADFTRAARPVIRWLTHYGMYPFYLLFGVVLVLGWRRRQPQWRYIATGYFAAQLLGAFAIVRALKIGFGRLRPDAANGLDQWQGVTLESAQHSFPSGHTADLVTSMIFVALLWRRVPVAVAALAWALAVAGSRMALAQHYPTDVLAGAAIAAVVSLTIARAWVWPRLAPARVPAAGGPVL